MPSFDIVSKVDIQALDNAVNVTTREITNRFDFKGSHVVIDLDKKTFQIHVETDDEMKMRQLLEVLVSRAHKQGIAPEAFDLSKPGHQSGKYWKKEVTVRNGLPQDDAKKVVKLIKDSGLKVQPAINEDFVRVNGKKIDDLQAVIALCRGADLPFPLQYVNMRS
ncbi:MAG TPA: YajQ family cyclic di-GMP-binding protein [Chitinophagaceae bacterium]|nr:YajQ family cyclic di-GMP-binding protein [Chitinophagaceae bacterium]